MTTTGAPAPAKQGTPRASHRASRHPAARAAWRALCTGVSAGLFALVVLLALMVIVVPKVAGATPLTILTGSMEPTLPPGTLIVVKSEPLTNIRMGDVMTYQIRPGRPDVISHRVVGITMNSDGSRSFTTKGDNNSDADPTVSADQVRGVLWYSLPWLGYVSTAGAAGHGSWLVPLGAFLLLGYAAYMIATSLLSRTRRRTRRQK